MLSGSDPTGSGEVLSGFGDRREIELPVDAGFSRGEAIKIATLKRAVYLSKDKHAPPDIMCTGEWEWLRCPRKCPRSEMSDFIPTGFPVLLS